MTDYQQTQELRQKFIQDQLNSKMTFGKYKGQTLQYVLDNNPNYIIWATENVEFFEVSAEISTLAHQASSARKPEYRKPYEHDPLDDDYFNYGYDPYEYFD